MNPKLYIATIVFLFSQITYAQADFEQMKISRSIASDDISPSDSDKNERPTSGEVEDKVVEGETIAEKVIDSEPKTLEEQLKQQRNSFNKKVSQNLLTQRYGQDGESMSKEKQVRIRDLYAQVTKLLFSGKIKLQRANWAANYLLNHLNEVVLRAVRDAIKEGKIRDYFFMAMFQNKVKKIVSQAGATPKNIEKEKLSDNSSKVSEEKSSTVEKKTSNVSESTQDIKEEIREKAASLGTETVSLELFDKFLIAAEAQKMSKSRVKYLTEKMRQDPNKMFLSKLLKAVEEGKLKDNFWTDMSWFDYSFKSKVDSLAKSTILRIQTDSAHRTEQNEAYEIALKENEQREVVIQKEKQLNELLDEMRKSLSEIIPPNRVNKFFKKYTFNEIQAKFINDLFIEQRVEADNFHQAAKLAGRIRNETDAKIALEIATQRPDRQLKEFDNRQFTKSLDAIIKYQNDRRIYLVELFKHVLISLDEKELVKMLESRKFKRELVQAQHFNQGYLERVKALMNFYSPTEAFINAKNLIADYQTKYLEGATPQQAANLIKYPQYVKTKYDLLKFDVVGVDNPYANVTGLRTKGDIKVLQIYQERELDVFHFRRRFISGENETEEYIELEKVLREKEIDVRHIKNLVYMSEYDPEKNKELFELCKKNDLDSNSVKEVINSIRLEMSDIAHDVLEKLERLEIGKTLFKKPYPITTDTMNILLTEFKSEGSKSMYGSVVDIDESLILKYFRLIAESSVKDHATFSKLREVNFDADFILNKMKEAPLHVEYMEKGVGSSEEVAKFISKNNKNVQLYLDTIGSFAKDSEAARKAFIAIFHKTQDFGDAKKYLGLLTAHQNSPEVIEEIRELALKGYFAIHINMNLKNEIPYIKAKKGLNSNQIMILNAFKNREKERGNKEFNKHIDSIKGLLKNIPEKDTIGLTSVMISAINNLKQNYEQIMAVTPVIANLETAEQIRFLEALYDIKESSNLDFQKIEKYLKRDVNPVALKSIESVKRIGFDFIPDIEQYLKFHLPEQARIIERLVENEINPAKYLIDVNKIGSYENQPERRKAIEAALEFAIPVYHKRELLDVLFDYILHLENMEQEKLYEHALYTFGHKDLIDKLNQSLYAIREVGDDKNKINILKLFIGGEINEKTLSTYLASENVTEGQVRLLHQFNSESQADLIRFITNPQAENVLGRLIDLGVLVTFMSEDIQSLSDSDLEKLERRVRDEIRVPTELRKDSKASDRAKAKAKEKVLAQFIAIFNDFDCQNLLD